MINLTVINLKNLIKILIKIIIVTLIVTMIFELLKIIRSINFISKVKEKISQIDVKLIQSSTSIFEIQTIETFNNDDIILSSEFESFQNESSVESNEKIASIEKNIKVEKIEKEIDLRNVITKVVNEKNKNDTFNLNYGSVKIKNESSYVLSEDMLKPDVNFTNKNDILIFHTHTCESYTPTSQNSYVATGNYRTTDLNYSVAKVGNELSNCLKSKGYSINHNTTYHDYPAYNGSYTRSLSTIKNMKAQRNSAQLVIDLHRDALGDGSSYGPTVMIGEEQVAQLMFVIGTNGGGLSHNNWNTNLKFAILIQQKANEMYPGLFKPIIVRDSRYNQHMADASCIIEVGATANTLEQATGSMKYLAEVISEVMK